jgi:hypothetical protein
MKMGGAGRRDIIFFIFLMQLDAIANFKNKFDNDELTLCPVITNILERSK